MPRSPKARKWTFRRVGSAAVLLSFAWVVLRCSNSCDWVPRAAPEANPREHVPAVPTPVDVREAVTAGPVESGADPLGVARVVSEEVAGLPAAPERNLRFEVYYRSGRPIAHANITIAGYVEGQPAQSTRSVDADAQGCAMIIVPAAWLLYGLLLIQVYDESALVFDGLVADSDPIRVYCHSDPEDPQWVMEGRVEVVGLDDRTAWFVQVVRATQTAATSMPLASSAWHGACNGPLGEVKVRWLARKSGELERSVFLCVHESKGRRLLAAREFSGERDLAQQLHQGIRFDRASVEVHVPRLHEALPTRLFWILPKAGMAAMEAMWDPLHNAFLAELPYGDYVVRGFYDGGHYGESSVVVESRFLKIVAWDRVVPGAYELQVDARYEDGEGVLRGKIEFVRLDEQGGQGLQRGRAEWDPKAPVGAVTLKGLCPGKYAIRVHDLGRGGMGFGVAVVPEDLALTVSMKRKGDLLIVPSDGSGLIAFGLDRTQCSIRWRYTEDVWSAGEENAASGQWMIKAIDVGREVQVAVQGESWSGAQTIRIAEDGLGGPTVMRVPIEPDVELRGHVQSAAGGRLGNAKVLLDYGTLPRPWEQGITGADGRFRLIARRSPTVVLMRVLADGVELLQREVDIHDAADLVLVCER